MLCIIIRGIPGCGKSALVKVLTDFWGDRGTSAVCSSDDFLIDDDGEYKFDKIRSARAHAKCMQKFEKALASKTGLVIIDNTNVKKEHFSSYLRKANEAEYKVFCIIVENRHGGKSVHDVPIDKINEMLSDFSIKL